jgi:fumarate reductase flavoprotein subunit
MDFNRISKPKEMDTDIVVIGGGGTGLAAAVAAAEKGVRVILLEKRGAPAGNTALAIGLFAADSSVQKRMCISAPKDEVFRTAMEYSHWKIDPRIFRAFVEKSGDTIQWLEEKGITFKEIPSMYPGQVFRTWHCADEMKGTGAIFVKLFRKHCEELGVQLFTKCPARRILTNKKGEVTGVLAGIKGQELKISAKSVIIATGGYGGNKELLKRYFPSYDENMVYTGFPHVTGDGLLMALEIGASTEGLGILMLHPHCYPGSMYLNTVAVQPVTVWVNKKGERFTDETITFHYVECGNAVNRQPDKCVYTLFDEKIKNRIIEEGLLTLGLRETGVYAGAKLTKLENELRKETDKGGVKISDSLNGIAKWIGVVPKVLKTTIDEYNASCDKGHDAIFAKDRKYLQALRTPPYFAIRCYSSFLTTIGGVKINHHMEVLDTQDNPIPGLYAGGDTAGGLASDTYCMPLSGSAFGFAVNSGRIAGENAAETVKTRGSAKKED